MLVSLCPADLDVSRQIEAKLRPILDWELDQLVGAAAKGKRCDRIWKDGP